MSLTKSAPFKLSVVIPVYNEQYTIGEVIDKVRSVDLSRTMDQQMLLRR
jgi:glycosyltransferase involved in cell wall biosynthesis